MPKSQWQEKAHFKKTREHKQEVKQLEEELFTLPLQAEHPEIAYPQDNPPPDVENQAEAQAEVETGTKDIQQLQEQQQEQQQPEDQKFAGPEESAVHQLEWPTMYPMVT